MATKTTHASRRRRTPKQPERSSETRQLKERLRAVRAIGTALTQTVGLDQLLERIVPQVSRLMRATRSTLFFFDAGSNEIWSKVAQGEEKLEIRLKLGEGIAGWVAQYRKAINIYDAYRDPRFNPRVDAKTGFRTKSVAATPLLDREGKLLGVLQVLNRRSGPCFTKQDVELLAAIGAQTANAVENARLAQQILDQSREIEAARQRAERRRAELDLLYQLEQESSASTNLDELLDSMIVRVCERVRSEAGSVLLSDRETGRLFFRGVSGSRKEDLKRVVLEPGEGVVGWVAQNGEPLVVNRPEDEPRHARQLAKTLSHTVTALLAVPLIWDQRVIGAVEVLNPRPRPSGAAGYDLEDLKVMTLIAGQVARAVTLTRERQARLDTERLAIIGRMLAGVAHDLRNPMTAIAGYAHLMATEEQLPEREDYCRRVLSQIEEMTAMIGDLLAFARGDTQLSPTAVDAQRLAEEAAETLRVQCEPRGIQLNVEATAGTVVVDIGRTKRILYNLAKNAVEVLSRGGSLRISLTANAGNLKLVVSDNGPGIPDEVRAHLFQPFVTTKKGHGTGLGLSIVKRFVADHGGSVSVESTPGTGTTFSVDLPRLALTRVAQEQG